MKNKVTLFETAHKQLNNIFNYGYDNYGYHNTSKYLKGLINTLEKTAITKKHQGIDWKKVPRECIFDLTEETVYFIKYKKHIIFFRDFGNSIGVISILRDCQDILSRIREDIATLQH